MKLNKLVIQGFKSFKDKTVIDFNHSITGIVGPNGCGKSNIVDALFWVMGEQSAKHLRGSSMKDVIFSGSSKYPPASWAEVSLFLENTEQKHVHVGDKVICPTEFQLTRKLYRSGDSEYRINGIPARLKDIQEVFLDTGVGTKSYSIIAQGEINKLVQSGPLEKRVMIEEVAGITRFKVRKKESIRKLELTEQNMARLIDLKEEVYKQLKILEEQAGKAERAIVLRDRVQQNELIVESHKEMELLSFYSDKGKELREITENLQNGQIEKADLEARIENLKIDKDVISDKTEILQKEYNELAKKLAAAEERLKYLIRNKDEKRVLLKTRSEENIEIKKELENRTKKLEEWEKELETLEENEVSEESYLDLQNHVDILQDEIIIKEETIEGLKKEIEDKKEGLFHLRQELFKAKSRKTDVEEKFDEIISKIDFTEKELLNQKENLTKKSSLKDQKETELKTIEQEKTTLSHQIRENQTLLVKLKEDIEKDQNLINKLDAKINSLEEMKFYDFHPTLQNGEFLKTEEGENFKRLFELINCEDQYAAGVQRFLGSKLETLVSPQDINSRDHLNSFIDYFSKEGNESFLHALYTEEVERSSLKFNLDEIWAQDVVLVKDEKLESLISIFSNVVFVKDLNKEKINIYLDLIRDEKIKEIDILSLDGKIHIKKERGVTEVYLGEENKNGEDSLSPIKRNNEIERLKVELQTIEERVRINEGLRQNPKDELKNLMENFQRKEIKEQELKTAVAVLKNENENGKNLVKKLEIDWEDLKKKREFLSKEKLNFLGKEAECENQEKEYKTDIEDREETLKEVLEDFSYKKSIFAEEKERLITQKNKFETYSREVTNLNRQIEDIEEQLEKLDEREKNNLVLIEQYTVESDDSEKESIVLSEDNIVLAKELKEREKILQQSKKELQEKIDQLEKDDKHIRALNNKISKWEKDILYIQTKVEQSVEEEERTVRNMFEKYHVNLRRRMMEHLELHPSSIEGLKSVDEMFITVVDGIQRKIEESPFEFHRKYGQELIACKERYQRSVRELQAIGEINWTAVDEYSRQKKRYQFLVDQEIQLKKSLDDLKMAIMHIDERCKERFKSAFHDVNERFQKVFPILFGGGQAYLQMQGPFEDLDAGLDIVAQPPGKKMQNINLMSGGEKAMTAVSLIFSTFLVRPSPFCLLDEVDAPLDDANVTRFNEMLREMSEESQFIVITHNKKTMELNDVLYGITMQEPGISKTVSVQLH